MNNESSSTSGIVIGILIVVVIAIVAWVAYTQGFFQAKEEKPEDTSGLEINIGGSTDTPSKSPAY